jgi:O-antigen ligase
MDWDALWRKSHTQQLFSVLRDTAIEQESSAVVDASRAISETLDLRYRISIANSAAARPFLAQCGLLLRAWRVSSARAFSVRTPADPRTELEHVSQRAVLLVLAVFVLVLPFRLESPTIVNLVTVSLLGIGVVALLVHSPYRASGAQLRVVGPLVLLVLLALATLGTALNPTIHARFILIVTLLAVGAAVGAVVLTELWRLLWLVTAVASGIGYLSLIHVAVPFSFGDTLLPPRALGPIQFELPRSLGIDMGYGAYGILVAIGVAVVITTVLYRDEGWLPSPHAEYAAGIAIVGLLLGAYIGQSRSMYLNLMAIAGVLTTVGYLRSEIRFRRGVRMVVVVVAAVAAVVIVPDLARVFVSAAEGSTMSRVAQYGLAIELMTTRPLTGYGWGHFGSVFPAGFQVHNLWLNVGVATGIGGFILSLLSFGWLWLCLFIRAVTAPRSEVPIVLVSLLALTGGVVELALFPGVSDITVLLLVVSTVGLR